MLQKVIGDVAELESILVSNTYGTIGRELQVKATIMGLGNSDKLDLEFWADTPSRKYEDLAKIKTKGLSPGRCSLLDMACNQHKTNFGCYSVCSLCRHEGILFYLKTCSQMSC